MPKYINSRRAANAKVHKAVRVDEQSTYSGDPDELVPACGALLDLASANHTTVDQPEPWWPLCPKPKCFGTELKEQKETRS